MRKQNINLIVLLTIPIGDIVLSWAGRSGVQAPTKIIPDVTLEKGKAEKE